MRESLTHGFTLIELLVVIAIIAILMATLLPALSKARGAARRVVCLGKMTTFGQANAMYMDDYNGYVGAVSKVWQSVLCPYVENGKEWINWKLAPAGNPGGNWACPENPEGKGDHTSGALDGQGPAWGITAGNTDHIIEDPPTINYDAPRNIRQVRDPSGKSYLVEASRSFIHFANCEPFPIGLRDGTDGRGIRMRHMRKANVLFLDARAASYGAPPLPPFGGNHATVFEWFRMDWSDTPDGL